MGIKETEKRVEILTGDDAALGQKGKIIALEPAEIK